MAEKVLYYGGIVAVGTTAAVVCGPVIVAGAHLIGFTATGVAATSYAAGLMSAYGTPVAIATLQSIGATSAISTGTSVLTGVAAAATFGWWKK